MATLKASTEQIRAYVQQRAAEAAAARAAEKERQRLARRKPPPVPPEVAEKTRAAKARLASHSGVRVYAGMEIVPTPQRMAKGGIGVHTLTEADGTRGRPVYRSKGPVEQYASDWPPEVYNAFAKLVVDAKAAQGPSLIVDLNRNGGSGIGKLGGLGNVHQGVRDAAERFHWVRERITEGAREVIDWLVLEVRREATGESLTLAEAGTMIFPAFRDKATAKGIAIGRLLGAGEELAKEYRKYAVLSRDHERREMKVVG